MSSPSSNEVKIRLEVSVPTGMTVNLGEVRPALPDPIQIFFNAAGNPDTGSTYQGGDNVCVQPIGGSSLGSVRLFFTFPNTLYAVSAIVYPITFDHGTPEPPNGAQPGSPSQNNTVWTWNALTSADHTTSLNTARNVTRLWTKATAQSPWVPDDQTFPFFGYSGPDGPCASGSSGSGPSGSGGGGAPWPALAVHVPDGSKAGRYKATPIGALSWEVTIDRVVYKLDLTHTGSAAYLSCPSTTVRARAAGQNPVFAVFPGSIVGAGGDVVVFQL